MNDPKPQFKTHLISDEALIARLVGYEATTPDQDLVVLDTETDGLSEKTANLYGIGICFNTKQAFYIPWRKLGGEKWWTPNVEAIIIKWLKDITQKRKVLAYNAVYDLLILENNIGLVLDDRLYSDPILQKHSLDEEPPFGLKDVAVNKLGNWADKAQEALLENIKKNGGKTTKENMEMFKADTEVLAEYCCWDVLLTLMLFYIFEKELEKEGLLDLFYKEEVMPLYTAVTIPMKRRGFNIDVPYFTQLKEDIQREIKQLEDEMMTDVAEDVGWIEAEHLKNEFPMSNKGNFPKIAGEYLDIPLPVSQKTGKVTLAAKAVQLQKQATPQFTKFYNWIGGVEAAPGLGVPQTCPISLKDIHEIQKKMYFGKYPEERYVFNLRSNDDLAKLLVDIWGLKPLEKTETGKPKLDDDFLEHAIGLGGDPKCIDFIYKLLDFKRLNKLLSTYVEGILERQIDGIIYTSMLQFGTISGRYSSRNPNLQNIPRHKEDDSGISERVLKYVNAIKKGFVAPKGYKIVNADYSALEPRCFSHVCGDEKLVDVWIKNEDLYSRVGIDTFKLKDISANPNDDNYLKKKNPEFRQKSKVFCLAVPYGAEEYRIADAMKIPVGEAKQIISSYLYSYPGLKKYMKDCDFEAKNYGEVRTQFGRVRHLKKAKMFNVIYGDDILDYKYAKKNGLTEQRWQYKNQLNNSKNFKIQGMAAHIVNRAMIACAREFKLAGIVGWIALQVHDEITCIVREDQSDKAAKILKDCMEKTTIISVPLIAEPLIADNWADAK